MSWQMCYLSCIARRVLKSTLGEMKKGRRGVCGRGMVVVVGGGLSGTSATTLMEDNLSAGVIT